ncbi:hypothetical protein F5X98DRAFT_381626 [Xylaria grammica]|nr:hypothetical protein F5X98DRAFT_381626 [Xylaria grammica]
MWGGGERVLDDESHLDKIGQYILNPPGASDLRVEFSDFGSDGDQPVGDFPPDLLGPRSWGVLYEPLMEMLPFRREDPPRPPTPYPFSTTPSWRALETRRDGCPPAYPKKVREPVPNQNRFVYTHIVRHNFDHHGATARPKTDNCTRLVERRRSAVDHTDDSDVQRQILAHNARIA